MKKLLALLLFTALLISLVGCGSSPSNGTDPDSNSDSKPDSESAEPIVLKFGTHLTENHNLTVNAVKPWMDRVTELTDGQVTFEHYPNSQMGKASDTYKLVKNGTLDLGYTLYVQEVLPLMDLPMLPNLYEDPAIATAAYWEVMNQAPFVDYLADAGIKPIMAVVWEPYTIATVSSKPETIEDFEQLKLRSSGGLHNEATAAIGATPVSISASESLEALRKETVDGYWGSTTSWLDYQFDQVLKYGVTNLPLNGWGGIFSINKDVYDSLPENVQEAIDTANEEMNEQLGKYIKEICEQAWIDAADSGVELYEVSDDVVQEMQERLAPISQAWLDEQDAAGYPATEVYNQFLDAYEKHSQ
jgi:TRAP-type C4-dicarboxylate transport system substrate-binding protein